MKHKKILQIITLGIFLIGSSQNSNAQFLKKLKDKAIGAAAKTVNDVVSKKEKKKTPETKTPNNKKKEPIVSIKEKKETKKQTQEIDYSDVYIIKSSSPKFKSIHLQSHKGLPRFGTNNLYYFKNKYGAQDVNRPKNELLKIGHRNYNNLLNMKYLSTYYNDMDLEYITELTHENKNNKKDLHSYVAQNKLLKLAYNISTEELKHTYFCDTNDPNCSSNRNWGGTTDDFEIQEKFAAFNKENLSILRKWSANLFTNNEEKAYLVNKYEFYAFANKAIQYDFDTNGYWIDILNNNKLTSTGPQYHLNQNFFHEFYPKTSYGNKHHNQMNNPDNFRPKTLLKMSPEKAEAMINRKPKYIYSAIKVNIVYKELNDSQTHSPNIKYTYHLADPVIEFYEDIALTKKIGQLSLENATYKKTD